MRISRTAMAERDRMGALLGLTAWLSPGYPVGAYSYSHGLEWAVGADEVTDGPTAREWIAGCLAEGAGRNDAILLVQAMRGEDVDELDALARALAPARERLAETLGQGAAFAEVTAAAWSRGDGVPRAYPVAVGLAARAAGLPERETVTLYLQAFAANLVSAAVRLVPLGQTEGQAIVAELSLLMLSLAEEALAAPLDEIGGCAFRADIAAMRHETQNVRLFRS